MECALCCSKSGFSSSCRTRNTKPVLRTTGSFPRIASSFAGIVIQARQIMPWRLGSKLLVPRPPHSVGPSYPANASVETPLLKGLMRDYNRGYRCPGTWNHGVQSKDAPSILGQKRFRANGEFVLRSLLSLDRMPASQGVNRVHEKNRMVPMKVWHLL